MKKLTLGIIILFGISCDQNKKTEFNLKGTTNGFKDGEYLYLDFERKTIDSAKIINNTFEFTTKLTESPVNLWLHDKRFSNYRSFWAENNSMSFDAAKTNFRNATITGSKTEHLSFNLYKKIDTLPWKDGQQAEMDFAKNNPNSIISASILSVYSTSWGKEVTQEIYNQFSIENKNSNYGKQIKRYIQLNKNPKIGDQFPDFEQQDQNGISKKLSEVKGKLVLLEFWASWCGPCLKENPNLIKTYKKFNPLGFEIFAVSLDENKENWVNTIIKDSLTWTHVSDLKGQQNEPSLIYGINGIPDNFLIDENGKIIARNLRGDELNKKIQEILE